MKRSLTATIFALGVLIALAIPTVYAQTTEPRCTARMARSLSVRGIRLGMTTEEVLALFPGANNRSDVRAKLARVNDSPNYGIARLSFQRHDESQSLNNERFAGVANIDVILFDGRLVEFWVSYISFDAGGASWDSNDQWIIKLSETLKLPEPRYWDKSRLMCEGIQITASPGSLRISDPAFYKLAKDRELDLGEKRRREFKP